MANKKPMLIKTLLDSGMIIFSVLIALFINEWRSHYREQVKTNQILENIKGEIKINQKFILKLVAYHEVVRENIRQAHDKDSVEQIFFPNVSFDIFEVAPKGIIQGQLNNIAWTVAKTDKITNRISLDKSQMLFAVYEQQITVNETIDRILTLLSTRELQRKKLVKESVIVFEREMNSLIGQEYNLSHKYSKTLAIFK